MYITTKSQFQQFNECKPANRTPQLIPTHLAPFRRLVRVQVPLLHKHHLVVLLVLLRLLLPLAAAALLPLLAQPQPLPTPAPVGMDSYGAF